MENKPLVLGLCTANRCRSQMFEAIVRHLGDDKVEVISAGTNITSVHPLAVKVLSELGIKVSGQLSKKIKKIDTAKDELILLNHEGYLQAFKLSQLTNVITLCGGAKEVCPVFPVKVKKEHWSIDDPDSHKGSEQEVLPYFKSARDDIYKRVVEFLKNFKGEN